MSMDGWDVAEEAANESSGLFLRLAADGQKFVGVFAGEPYMRKVVWTGSGTEDYDPGNPAHEGEQVNTKFILNVYSPKSKALQLFECSAPTFKAIKVAKDKYGLGKWSFEVKRSGVGKKTSYSVLPETQLTDAERATIAALELHNIASIVGGGAPATPAAPPSSAAIDAQLAAPTPAADDDLPF